VAGAGIAGRGGESMKKAYVKYILALLLFGLNGIVASYISLNSYEIVLLRTAIGGLLLLGVFLASKRKPRGARNKKDLLYLAISGAAMGASWMFLYEAYTQIGVGVATLAYYCGPVLVMAIAPIVFREKITVAKGIGFLLVLAGMYLVNRQALERSGLSWGLLCGIMAAVMYVVMVVANKKAKSITGLENALLQLAFGFVVVAVFTVLRQGLTLTIAPQDVLPVLVLGVVNTGIGCYLYFSAIPQLPAQSVAICGYLEPVSALLFASVILRERLAGWQWVGTVLVIGGAAFGELYRRRKTAQSEK